MLERIKNLTATLVILILLTSLLFNFIHISSAGIRDIYSCYSIIEIQYDQNAANDPFLPIDMVKEIPVNINYFVRGYFEDEIPLVYIENFENFVFLDVISKPQWCTVSLSPEFLLMKATADGVEKNITLIIKVDENAHAYDVGTIGIEARVTNMGAIKGDTFYGNISFIPGFIPILAVDTPDGTTKLTGPKDTIHFPIDIKNLGNAKTVVSSNVLDPPKEWIISLDKDIIIGTGTIQDDAEKTITLTIQPPYNFGYHNEREVIQISLTPSYFEDPTIKGEEYIVSFIVQSKGFSTPGFESVWFIISTIVLLFLFNIRKSRKNIQYYKTRRK